MGSSADMKLQLVIEAISNTNAAFSALQRDLTKVQALTSNAASGGEQIGKSFQSGGEQGAAGMKRLHDETRNTHSMLGSMIQMAILFGGLSFAQKLASSALDYNKTLETSKLGIAAIMTSMGVITDQQGQVLTGQNKWNAAQALSVQAQKELQKIAMTTPATYEELVQAYQGLLAPSLANKLTFRETLDLTGLLTNSVKSMGMPMQQIVQEGRDLLSGTIDQNSQLARSLQITNEDIKKWREKGIIFEEIQKRLSGFVFAQNQFSNTWEGAWSNFKDVAQHALGDGSKPLFNFLKGEINKLTMDMVNITKDANGKIVDIQIKPEVARRVRDLAEDLKKLVQILETVAKWTGKVAEPLVWGAMVVGIGKMTLALSDLYKVVKTGEGLAKGGLLYRLITNPAALTAALAVAGLAYSANRGYDNVQLQKRSDSIRKQFGADGEDFNINQLQGQQLRAVLDKFPDATDDDIIKMIYGGAVKLPKPSFTDRYTSSSYKVQINEDLGKKLLETGPPPFDVKGEGKKTPDQIKKENAEARAAIEKNYQDQIDIVKTGESEKIEALKTAQKSREELFQTGAMSEEEFLKAKAQNEQEIITEEYNGIIAQQNLLLKEWMEKRGKFRPEDKKEKDDAEREFNKQYDSLEVQAKRKEGELSRAGIDERIAQVKRLREVETARREGDLKLLQEQLNGEKQLTAQLLEREKITPLQAEQRNIANEQSGLEAEYWNTFTKKKVGGLSAAQIAELDAQLSVLEQRMATLEQTTPGRIYKAEKETVSLDAKREEARISHDLADLDDKEKTRAIGKVDALVQRKKLLEDLLVGQQTVQNAIYPNDTTAWNSQQSAIDATRQKLTDVNLEIRNFSNELGGWLKEGFKSYIESIGGGFKQMEGLATATAQAMESSFSDFFFDAMQGKLKSFRDYVNSFLSSIDRAITNVLAQKTVTSILGFDYGGMLGFRAEGGGVTAGQPYIVGEKGMELFIPQASGYIVPNHAISKASPTALAGGKSGDLNVSVPVSIDGSGGGASLNASTATMLGQAVRAAVVQEIRRQQSPGGLLYHG